MEFSLSEDQLALQAAVREFARAEIAAVAAELDKDPRFPWHTLRKMGELGLLGVTTPEDLELAHELDDWPEVLSVGGSAIYGPLGERLAGPLEGEPGLLLADVDPAAIVRSRFDFDVTGHYARPDIFRLEVDRRPRRSVLSSSDPADPLPSGVPR